MLYRYCSATMLPSNKTPGGVLEGALICKYEFLGGGFLERGAHSVIYCTFKYTAMTSKSLPLGTVQ